MPAPKNVDDYVANKSEWSEELAKLRNVLQKTDLEETIKWGAPCYTLNGKNVVGLAAFKSYVGIWFHQGAVLSDPDGVLINAQEGKTKALRQWRFESMKDIKVRKVQAYVREAIEQERAGNRIKADRKKPVEVPTELGSALAKKKKARTGFEALTPGKRREYAEYIADAKRADTKERRLQKILPMLEAGIGLNDKYRDC